MKAPCLYHHRVREGFFKLDSIPSEVVANVFKYIPTLDMGRMMVVCRGFNQILSTNPSLWRIVDLDKLTSDKSALEIIKVFASPSRSRNTLSSIKASQWLPEVESDQILLVLNQNKATLRRLDLGLWCPAFGDQSQPITRFFNSFDRIERLNLTATDLPEADSQISGVLTMLATLDFNASVVWSEEDLFKISNLRSLYIEYSDCFSEEAQLNQVLPACSSTLNHLSIDFHFCAIPLICDLPLLSTLDLGENGNSEAMFSSCSLPSLKHLKGRPMNLDRLGFKTIQTVDFVVESEDMEDGFDRRIGALESIIRVCKDSSSTLSSIKLREGGEGGYGIDPFLRTLKVDYLLPLCSHLSDLYISKGQDLSLKLLAEVMVSRNFASEGWKFEGEEEEELERSCSKLVLHLDTSLSKGFRSAEKKVLSRIPKWMSRQAGRTEVREWVGKQDVHEEIRWI